MTETPSTRINYFIRDAAQRNQPIFESYEELRRLHPDQDIGYVDFDWKYYQYYHGRSDLDMERSPDSKSPVTFEDLPVDIIKKVVGKSDLRDCMVLRKVSRDLRSLVDSAPVCCAFFHFKLEDCFSIIYLDNWKLEYKTEGGKCKVTAYRRDTEKEDDDGGCMVTSNRRGTQKTKIYWDDRNFKEAMLADVMTFLKNPKLKINQFGLGERKQRSRAEFLKLLQPMNLRLNVRSVECTDLKLIYLYEQCLNPQKLEEYFLFGAFKLEQFYVEVTKTEVSRLLKTAKLKIRNISFDEYSDELCANFLEILESFDGLLRFSSVSIGDDHRWIDIILRHLKPERKMEELKINHATLTMDQFNEISKLKEITTLINCTVPKEIGIEKLLQFKEVSADMEFTDENLEKIRDNLLNCPHLKKCRLEDRTNQDDEFTMTRRIMRIMSHNPAYDGFWRFSIPNSQDCFYIDFDDHRGLSIARY